MLAYFPLMTWKMEKKSNLIHLGYVKGMFEEVFGNKIPPFVSNVKQITGTVFVCRTILPIFCVLFSLFTFCLFLQCNYSAPLSQRGYHSCDYNTVAMTTPFPHDTVVQSWQLS